MSKINGFIFAQYPRLSLALIAALLGALLLAMFAGTASAQSDAAIGRGFTGVVTSVSASNGRLAIESKGSLFQLAINDSTVINVPPGQRRRPGGPAG
jgi:ABC-type glycerol-3-phosphate transport system substrate-binding protein